MSLKVENLPMEFKDKVKEILKKNYKVTISKGNKAILFYLEDCFTGWDSEDNRAEVNETFEMKVFGETHKVTIEIRGSFCFSLKELINIFNELELLFRGNIEKLEFV